MKTIAERVAALDEGRHIVTALGKSVLAEYGDGTGPLAVADVNMARALFAYAAQAEIEALTSAPEEQMARVSA